MHETNESFVLSIPEFHVKKGEIVAVCGRVGAGKSSLIHAILGDMETVSLPPFPLQPVRACPPSLSFSCTLASSEFDCSPNPLFPSHDLLTPFCVCSVLSTALSCFHQHPVFLIHPVSINTLFFDRVLPVHVFFPAPVASAHRSSHDRSCLLLLLVLVLLLFLLLLGGVAV